MRRQRLTSCLLALLWVVAGLAPAGLAPALAADDGFALFASFRDDARLARLQFAQKNTDDSGALLEEITGTIWFRSPNLFRLEYNAPDKPLIVSDGKDIYIYEKDLQQLIVRKFDPDGEHGLLSVLTGGLDSLRRRYVFSSAEEEQLVWLTGVALLADDPIPSVQLGFLPDKGNLHQLKMNDAFGGQLLLDITDLTRGGDDDGLFSFTPPPDTVVINSAN